MSGTPAAEDLLNDLSQGRNPAPQQDVTPAYQPVAVYDRSGTSWPGTITGWSTTGDQSILCHLKIRTSARWVIYNPDRILPLVQGGT
ncbi:hypothetical protein [Streptomyces sp. NPDC058045]|uniref:hypothetical protein n=1 Tax=Streptomyces sp. NPDC058045 TaxID=3346311 RepID=UPI0036ED0F5E